MDKPDVWEKKYKLRPVDFNDRAPNYRVNGQLRYMFCYSCDTELVKFGASDITTCPHCTHSTESHQDAGELQMVVFEAVADALIKHYRDTPQNLLAAIAWELLYGSSEGPGMLLYSEDMINQFELDESFFQDDEE